MSYHRGILLAPLMFIVLCLCYVTTARTDVIVFDQSYTPEPNIAYSIRTLGPLGQSFTPALSALDVVELRISDVRIDGQGAAFQLRIYQGENFNGPALGTSSLVTLPDGFGDFWKNRSRFPRVRNKA